MNEIIIGIFTLSGVLIGGFLQFLFAKTISKDDFKRNSEFESYLSYLNAVSGIKISRMKNDAKSYSENLAKLAESKLRILIIGSFETVSALEKFEEYGPVIRDQKSSELFADLISVMRKSLGEKTSVDFKSIERIILGKGKNDK